MSTNDSYNQTDLDEWRNAFYQAIDRQCESDTSAEATRLSRAERCLRLLRRAWQSALEGKHLAASAECDSSEQFVSMPAWSVDSNQLGRFQIIRELGRGGHGVVFLAHDPSLERLVALKIPQPGVVSNAELRHRFLREARTAARLQHPHLIPVYEVGEIGAIWFIASQYCAGPSLSQWIRRREGPVPARVAAQIAARLAGTVDYIHRQGVLHRDLKPANVLLELHPAYDSNHAEDRIHDESFAFIPKLTDFGLARIKDCAGQLTQTGAMAGTPAYMAPEQATGREAAIGPATDVYGLGAILYELITGRPPFQGDSDRDILRRIIDEVPLAPGRLRAGLPRELEAICLKCLEYDPILRYETAAALKDDLNRYLCGQPVRARRAGPMGRAVKWARRNPAVSCMTVLLILACLLGVTVASWQWRQLAVRQLRADENFRLAHQAVKEFHNLLDESDTYDAPEFQPLREEMLRKVVKYYQEFLASEGAGAELSADLADAHYRLGWIASFKGQMAGAIDHYETALPIWEHLVSRQPERSDHAYFLAKTAAYLGHAHRELGNHDFALRSCQRAQAVLSNELQRRPGDVLVRAELARVLHEIGSLHIALRDDDRALRCQEEARDIWLQLRDAQPESSKFQIGLGEAFRKIAQAKMALGDHVEAAACCERAIEILQHVVSQSGRDLSARHSLAQALHNSGRLSERRGDPERAKAAFQRGHRHYQELAEQHPAVADYKLGLAINARCLARTHAALREHAQETEYYELSVRLHEELHRLDPKSPLHSYHLSTAYCAMASAHQDAGRWEESIVWLDLAAGVRSTCESTKMRRCHEKLVRRYELVAQRLGESDLGAATASKVASLRVRLRGVTAETYSSPNVVTTAERKSRQ